MYVAHQIQIVNLLLICALEGVRGDMESSLQQPQQRGDHVRTSPQERKDILAEPDEVQRTLQVAHHRTGRLT